MSCASAGHTDASHVSHKSYLIGFILSIILTVIPFTMVMQGSARESTLIAVLVICSVVQIIVHMVYFLHLNTSSEQQWSLIAFVFAMMIIAILVVGSLWIMWHLNHNLMCH
ncbi:cytochrome C oxidase [Sodalis-like endosymbiont of Proechinophthirus fluctus]|uniref:cytochrome o ubiquinol oxidase subunit IV n=1 Tax=Sodalis-like endosymbiont of Proechinophthirus fluctus TaxID=1462730 RepID=UPI0007A8AE77|nr:cytochrome o ubiquinol oxidase subunit IV [Sodalis-like endosymbiont of Proechinophthirus fluctus]KYP95600.1 cytochrome C oxidase [Sodalis-like endosymbiont of Proechinophthirus fluctus]